MTRCWLEPSLCWLAWFRLQNGSEFWIIRVKVTINHVLQARKILIWVTFRDLSLPAVDPGSYFVWHLGSQGIFTSPLRSLWLSYEQKLSILLALGLIIQKSQKLTFDLTLTRESRSLGGVVGSSPIVARSCGPPHHRGIGGWCYFCAMCMDVLHDWWLYIYIY